MTSGKPTRSGDVFVWLDSRVLLTLLDDGADARKHLTSNTLVEVVDFYVEDEAFQVASQINVTNVMCCAQHQRVESERRDGGN